MNDRDSKQVKRIVIVLWLIHLLVIAIIVALGAYQIRDIKRQLGTVPTATTTEKITERVLVQPQQVIDHVAVPGPAGAQGAKGDTPPPVDYKFVDSLVASRVLQFIDLVPKPKNGKDGVDGREIEYGRDRENGQIKWQRYVGTTVWQPINVVDVP